MKNWFGRESHPSDELIHWSRVKFCDRGRREDPEFKKFVDQLRADWDLIHGDKKVSAAFERLLEAHRCLLSSEQGEIDAGEDL